MSPTCRDERLSLSLAQRLDVAMKHGADMSGAPAATGFDALLASTEPALRPLCSELRDLIRSLHADAVELVWMRQGICSFGVGPKKMRNHYALIAPYSTHVNLGFYHGAMLEDPASLLEGTGKAMRHVKIRSAAEISRPALRALLRQAVDERMAYR